MTSSTPGPGVPPLLPLKHHPRLLAACAAAGLALGLGVAAVSPATYTAEVRLAVGTGEMSSLQIPGYPTASRDMAENYARWVTTTGAGGKVITDGSVELSASPLPDSNIVRLEAKSTDADAATTAAADAAAALRDEVNKVREEDDPEKVLQEIEDHAAEVAIANEHTIVLGDAYRDAYAQVVAGTLTEADIQDWESQYADAQSYYRSLNAQQVAREARYQRLVSQNTTEADLTIVQEAGVTGNDKVSNLQRYGLIGLVGGGVIGFGAAHLAYRRSARP